MEAKSADRRGDGGGSKIRARGRDWSTEEEDPNPRTKGSRIGGRRHQRLDRIGGICLRHEMRRRREEALEGDDDGGVLDLEPAELEGGPDADEEGGLGAEEEGEGGEENWQLILSNNQIAGGLEFLVEAGLDSLRDLDLSNNQIQFLEDLAPLARLRLVSLDLYECGKIPQARVPARAAIYSRSPEMVTATMAARPRLSSPRSIN